jgi:hypothetical protein
VLTPAERREIAALRAQVNSLSAQVRSLAGIGVSNRSGPVQIRTTQLGFPAELTSDYDAGGSGSGGVGTGYSWKRKRLVPGLAEPFVNPGVQLAGSNAYSFVGDQNLVAGTDGWMEPSPDGSGFVFVHRNSHSGSGTDDGGGSCTLETVSFDVVTSSTCDASGGLRAVITRITLTGCNLSISAADAPANGGGSATCTGEVAVLATHPALSLVVPDGTHAGTYTLTWNAGQERWEYNGGGGGAPSFTASYSAGTWAISMDVSGTITDETNLVATCDPFGVSAPGTAFGSTANVTLGAA